MGPVSSEYDVVVIGTGGVGSAALLYAAAAGARTIGLDRFIAPHNRGSSHGETRIIRQAYFEDPRYVPLLVESYRLWHALEAASGKKLYFETGLLQVGAADGVVVPGVLRAAADHGLPIEQYTAAELAARWPAFRIPPAMVGVVERRAGFLSVEECITNQLAAARAAGAEVLAPCEVLGWEAGPPVRLRTAAGVITTGKLIVTAGPWAGQLLSDLGLNLEVRRKSMFWFSAQQSFTSAPCYLFELPDGVFYGFPEIGGRIKIAEHSGGLRIDDPSRVDREIDPHDAERIQAFLQTHLPQVPAGLARHQTCLYTMSVDEHFIVDRHPLYEHVFFAAGLSGHGFKFTPVLGKALAELALNGGTDLPIDLLSLGRFAT